jgi:hypothetical protein
MRQASFTWLTRGSGFAWRWRFRRRAAPERHAGVTITAQRHASVTLGD